MNNLVINADQQSGVYAGRKIVAVDAESIGGEACPGCVLIDAPQCLPCVGILRNDKRWVRWQYADPASSDTAMLDYLLEHCTCIKEWKTGRDAFESREENKPLRTREDVRRAMGGGK